MPGSPSQAKEPPQPVPVYELRDCRECGVRFPAMIEGGRYWCSAECIATACRKQRLAERVNARPPGDDFEPRVRKLHLSRRA